LPFVVSLFYNAVIDWKKAYIKINKENDKPFTSHKTKRAGIRKNLGNNFGIVNKT